MTRKPTGQPRRLRGRAKPVMAWVAKDPWGELWIETAQPTRDAKKWETIQDLRRELAEARREIEALKDALTTVVLELGDVQCGYPMPVVRAYNIATETLKGGE
jgi:hypothetical protein